jgi:hypothetical protein
VANELNSEVLRHLAKLGAQARLEQIDMERRAILAAFPELAGAGRGRPARRGVRTRAVKAAAPAPSAPGRRRRTMTPAQRKEVSERMTRYWAERRKAKAKGKG